MDQLMDFYKQKIVVPTGVVNGATAINDLGDEFSSTDDEEDDNLNYEQDYVNQEMQRYGAISKQNLPSGMCEVEGVEEMSYRNNPLNVYSQYNFNKTFMKPDLPIDSFREKIINLLGANNVVIIQGPTGCGKSTQVPQFILDDCKDKREYCNIVVTQPRRIATINVAKRVCEERGWTLGTVCGYQVGLEKKVSPDVILTYMTTGVLLQKIIKKKSLLEFTHIVVDEIHERNQDLDFLLLIIRKFLYTNSRTVKVILMSATIDADQFAHYFCSHSVDVTLPPIIRVDKKSNYTKSTFYLDNLQAPVENLRLKLPDFDINKPEISECIWNIFTFLINIFDKLDFPDVGTNEPIIGSVLVFLPGINEIEEASRLLQKYFEDIRKKKQTPNLIRWDIIPLHSSLPNDELAKAFIRAKPGTRKIILSTNIAESSITVPDSYYVVDFCMTKVMTVDPSTKYMSLKLEWASHVNCDQRAGRVGRIGNGRVYRLVPKNFFMEQMPSKSIPEMLRAPLERIVLHSKMLNLNDTPQQILALALQPPNLKDIKTTILSLKEVGGLLQTCKGRYTSMDGDLTFLGTVMASLPLDIRLSKLIILGHLFSCLDEAIIMAAGCSIQNIFSIPFQQRFNAYRKLLLWADGSFSDPIALLNVYQVWQAYKRDGQFSNFAEENRWCNMNLVSLRGLKEWNMLITEISQRLERLQIKVIPRQIQLSPDERPLVLKIILAGAFYPNFFIKEPHPDKFDEREAVRTIGGRNPFRCVYFTGMEASQPGPLYIRAIKNLLNNGNPGEGANISVGFDGSSKIYIEFKNQRSEQQTLSVAGRQLVADTIPGKVSKEVYEAIRKRQLRYAFDLKLLPEEDAWRWAELNGFERKSTLQKWESLPVSAREVNEDGEIINFQSYSPIPGLDLEWITIRITEYIDAGHFWANQLDSEAYLSQLEDILNRTVLQSAISVKEQVKVDKIYGTRYVEDNLFYRCQVVSINGKFAQVFFMDYGNIQTVPLKELYILPEHPICSMAPLAIECVLYGIQPSRKMNPKGVWSDQTNAIWKEQTFNILLYGKIYSVVENVVYLEVFKQQDGKPLNCIMVEEGYAEPAEESFLSKQDHQKRQTVLSAENPCMEALRYGFDRVQNYEDFAAPKINKNYRTIQLKGPYSPLEMKVFGCLESASNKTIEIEGNSVNAVLLDSEPHSMHSRLLVAGYVSQSAGGDRLNLRQTTLMPTLPGFPMLATLLFCPTMEPKLTNDGTRVASILCGLGYDKYINKAYYPAHDFVLDLDTELTETEINQVNKVRYTLNQGIKVMSEISQDICTPNEILRIQKSLKSEFFKLHYTHREPVEKHSVEWANRWGKNNFEAVMLKPNVPEENEDIWPLLWFYKLVKGAGVQIQKNLEEIDLMCRRAIPMKEIDCLLCQAHLLTLSDVIYHAISTEHEENVSDYYMSLQKENEDNDDED